VAYCSAADVQGRYGPKALNWADGDASLIEAACQDASAEIDGYLALAGIKLPLDPMPSYMPGYAVDMAAYLLLVRSGFVSQGAGEEELGKRAAAARSFFEKWAEGKFDSGDKDGSPLADAATVRRRVRYSADERLNLLGYR